ncbi:MAG: ABC transporter ATP-binding protein [Vicinamibacterales bacterium]
MIQFDQVTKEYAGRVVVDGVTLTVATGELLVVVGGSGSGKTTLLKMVNRLVEPTGGRVAVDGVDVATVEPHELRRRIGYVFQKVGLFPHMSVAENIAITPRLLEWDAVRIRERVDGLLRLVELDPDLVRDRAPSQLSGGEQQRVGVARALAAGPATLLFDEPFGALDPITRDRLQGSLTRIHRETGFTGIFVTHDMAEALLLGQRIAVMDRGHLVQVGPPETLLREPASAYVTSLLDTPRQQALALTARFEGRRT